MERIAGRLSGKVAIVTGATSGIGEAVSRLFVREGARLVVVARRPAPCERLAKELAPRVVAVPGDVSDPRTAEEAVESAVRVFHGLDILVNNAGVNLPKDLVETSLEEFHRVLEVNCVGAFLMLRAAAKEMAKAGGAIVNVTSRAALVGIAQTAAYAASKGALLSLTRAAAIELASVGIRVNAVAPGLTDTPLTGRLLGGSDAVTATALRTNPLGRLARPEDVAFAALYLASDQSAHVTGVSLPIDGGYTAA